LPPGREGPAWAPPQTTSIPAKASGNSRPADRSPCLHPPQCVVHESRTRPAPHRAPPCGKDSPERPGASAAPVPSLPRGSILEVRGALPSPLRALALALIFQDPMFIGEFRPGAHVSHAVFVARHHHLSVFGD